MLILLVGPLMATAQQDGSPGKLEHYALDSFTNGKVKLKSGEISNQLLNYNLVTKEMIFKQGNRYLAVAEPERIDTVYIGKRKFVWKGKDGFYEFLAGSRYPLYAEYTCTVKEPGAGLGFGSSNTTAAVPLKTLINEGGAYQLKLPDGYEVISKRTLLIREGDLYHKIKNEQQLSRVFPAKNDIIKEWVSKHKTNFSNNDEIALLVQHIQ